MEWVSSPSLISCIRLTTWRAPKSSLAPAAEVELFLAMELSLLLLIIIRDSASSPDDVKAGLAVVLAAVVLKGNDAWSASFRNGLADTFSSS